MWLYPLRGLQVDHPNRVSAAGTTCLPTRKGFPYLVETKTEFT
ncbi:hypothetical protein [Sulfitobacter sp. EhC04]|nr:hypothetical protein [Sulfitobacter sp. EhC04]